jgi:nitrous oxidase accessory protein
MTFKQSPIHTLASLLLLMSINTLCAAQTLNVNPQDNLQQVLDSASAGDKVLLERGSYYGNFILNESIEISGKTGAIIDAKGKGHALIVNRADSYVHHLGIRNWGEDLTTMDAAIFVAKAASNTVIESNQLQGGGFGIWLDATPNASVINNTITGNKGLRSTDRGNGIHLYFVRNALIKDNQISQTRDGIYIESSNQSKLINNKINDLRYGIHYMYSYNNTLQGNVTSNTRTGYALMQSKYLTVIGNSSINDANYGMLLNYITHSTLKNNQIIGIQNKRNPHMRQSSSQGLEGKALFIYNSLYNEFSHNQFSDSDIGIHLTAGSENNKLFSNAFVRNKTQIKYVSTRTQDWAGNYWSDYLGWDLNSDGLGDTVYEPNDNVDKLLWKFPSAKLLFNSPAIQTLRWVQRQFPVLKSKGVTDSKPLMKAPNTVNIKMPDNNETKVEVSSTNKIKNSTMENSK